MMGKGPSDLEAVFASFEEVGKVYRRFAMPRQRYTIYWCRDLVQSLDQLWPDVKEFS